MRKAGGARQVRPEGPRRFEALKGQSYAARNRNLAREIEKMMAGVEVEVKSRRAAGDTRLLQVVASHGEESNVHKLKEKLIEGKEKVKYRGLDSRAGSNSVFLYDDGKNTPISSTHQYLLHTNTFCTHINTF